MSLSLASYLRDFGAPATPRDKAFAMSSAVDRHGKGVPLDAAFFEDSGPDIDALVADAFRRGRLEAFEESTEIHNADLAAERSRHREEVAELRTRFEQEFSTVIATRFDQISDMLVSVIGRQVAGTLSPFLDAAVTDLVVSRLAEAITRSMEDGKTVDVAVSGPQGLHAKLAAHFSGKDVNFTFNETDDLDLTVDFNGTVFATRLAEWAESLQEALA